MTGRYRVHATVLKPEPAPLTVFEHDTRVPVLRAPFGSYLRKAVSDSGEESYEIDLTWMNGYRVRESLARPGGRARFAVDNGRLVTTSVHQDGVPPRLARAALLAGLNEDLTTFRHNLSVHLTMLTSFALATTNQLSARHPVRNAAE